MKIPLVFDHWCKDCLSINNTREGFELSSGIFHSGTTFDAEIELDAEEEAELQAALDADYVPVFWVGKPNA